MQATEPPTYEGLDRALLEGLEADARPRQPSEPQQPATTVPVAANTSTPPAASGEILRRVQRQMRVAATQMSTANSQGLAVIQANILSDLDRLLAASDKPQQSTGQSTMSANGQRAAQAVPRSAGANQQSGDQPAQDAAAKASAGGIDVDASHQPRGLVERAWGRLPERVRQQLLQSARGEFLPQYEVEIQQYFQRLAELEGGGSQ